MKGKRITYFSSGVSLSRANASKKNMASLIKSTFDSSVESSFGAFGGAVNLKKLKKYKNPVLVASVDGVGTKTKIASQLNEWDSLGEDLVNHSVNDILCLGAEPLFFLDYIAFSKLKPKAIQGAIKGLAKACRKAQMPLIAGETAEMPGVYLKGELDLAGCIVGAAEKNLVPNPKKVKKGDALVALASSGLHTNGYSLARKVFKHFNPKKRLAPLKNPLGKELLKPHKSYLHSVLPLIKSKKVKAVAHITGGGIPGNLERVLPKGLGAEVEKDSVKVLPVFELIQEKGGVPEKDMWKTFNMGVGMVLIVRKGDAKDLLHSLKGKEKARLIGEIVKGSGVKIR